jgi:hypothetical protein
MVVKEGNALKRILAQDKARLADRLCHWMRLMDLNQTNLALRTGILQSVCHEIMTGGAFPSCGTIQKMARHTNLNIRYWLVGEKNGSSVRREL